eukprot:2000067-Rhodomonas_salina.1
MARGGVRFCEVWGLLCIRTSGCGGGRGMEVIGMKVTVAGETELREGEGEGDEEDCWRGKESERGAGKYRGKAGVGRCR